jgi:hypothetical protein
MTPAQTCPLRRVLFELEFASGDSRLSLKTKGVSPVLGSLTVPVAL